MNPRPKLIWQFYPFYLLISLLSFACVLFVARDAFFSSHTAADSSGWLTGRVFMWALATALLTTAASVAVIMHISRSLEKTREGARRFAEGDLGFRLDVPQSAELGGLAETLNRMAAQLNERITTINRQRNEQDAILGSMAEGVIAVDKNAAILQLNNAAATLLDATPESIIGRPLPELMRNRNLLQLIETTLEEGIPSEGEIAIHGRIDRSLEIHCTALKNPDGASIGALIVLNDITRLRRLEGVRRDFVANVSHELKTPLTSIKGFVETLQDGALDQPLEARRFCAIIAKQVDRLQAIIEDLLSLSRIEQEVEDGQVVLKEGKLRDVLTSAAQCCELQAAEKNISVNIDVIPNGPRVLMIRFLNRWRSTLSTMPLNTATPVKMLRCGSIQRKRIGLFNLLIRAAESSNRIFRAFSSDFTVWIKPAAEKSGEPDWDWPSLNISSRRMADISP
jgi:PAS domain S-box-containing protein